MNLRCCHSYSVAAHIVLRSVGHSYNLNFVTIQHGGHECSMSMSEEYGKGGVRGWYEFIYPTCMN